MEIGLKKLKNSILSLLKIQGSYIYFIIQPASPPKRIFLNAYCIKYLDELFNS